MNRVAATWEETRRLQAWPLHEQGWSRRQIAAALGVSAGAVSQGIPRARQAGPAALPRPPAPGAPRRLAAEPLTRRPGLWCRGPAASGFRGELWPRPRLAAVIRLECGVVSHPTPVGRLGNQLRWSPQQPARRARQRDAAAIGRWREATW